MLLDLLPVVIEGTGGGNTYDKTGTGSATVSGSASYYTEKLIRRRSPVWAPVQRIAKTGIGEMFPRGSGESDRALLSLMRQLFEEDELVSLDLL